MDDETEKMAPTVSIETVVVVRPLKVVAVLLGFLSILLLIMTVGSSSWVSTDGVNQGLWQFCRPLEPGKVDCYPIEETDWILACRGLTILSVIMCFLGCIVTCRGLCAGNFRSRYRSYYVGMLIFFLAVLFLVTALIIYPVKFSQQLTEAGNDNWQFDWTYGMGWGAVIFLLSSALLLCLDKDTDEVIYRETTSYQNSAIEEVSS